MIDVRLESSGDKLSGRLQVMANDGSVKALKFVRDKEFTEVKPEFLIIENKLHQYDEATGKYVPMRYPDNEEVEVDEFLYDEKGRLLVLEHTRQIARMVIFPNSDAVLVAGNRFVYNEMRYTWNSKTKKFEEVKITMTKEEVLAKADEFLSGGYKNYLNPTGPTYFRGSNGQMMGGIEFNLVWADLGITPSDWLERDYGVRRIVDTTPVFLGLYWDDEQKMLFGALDKNGRPFVWLAKTGFKRPESEALNKMLVGYEYTAHKGEYPRWDIGNPILINPDGLANALMQEQGKPVLVRLHSFKSIKTEGYGDKDRKALEELYASNNYEFVESLIKAYEGVHECPFAFWSIDEFNNFNGSSLPGLHSIEVWLGDN